MKKYLILVLFTLLSTLSVRAAVYEPLYISSYDLSVLGSNAYIIKTTNDVSQLIQYSFPELTQGATLTLGENFTYAYAYADGIVVYSYLDDVTTDETFAPEGSEKSLPVYKTVTQIDSYDANLVAKGSTSIENQYYYAYITEGASADVEESSDTDGTTSANKCGPRGKKKGKCSPVALGRSFKPKNK